MPALSELVSVRTRYRRAVNLSTDSHDARALDDILVTPLVAHALPIWKARRVNAVS